MVEPNNQLSSRRADVIGLLVALGLALGFFGVSLWLQIAKWNALHWACFDYANVADVFEATLSGRFRYFDGAHLFGSLLQQTSLIYLAIYALYRSPIALMVGHSLVFSLAVFLCYVAGRTVFSRPRWPLLFAVALALNPIFDLCTMSGFRYAGPIAPAAFGAYIAWRRYRRGLLILCAAVMCASQITMIPGVILLGPVLWWRNRRARHSWLLTITGAAFLVLDVALVLIAAKLSGLQPPTNMVHMNAFGHSFAEIVKTIVTRPGLILSNLLYAKNAVFLLYPAALLGLPLLAPWWLVAALPEMFHIALATYSITELDPRTIFAANMHGSWLSFFSTEFPLFVPFFFLAALDGAQWVAGWVTARWPSRASAWSTAAAGVFFVVTLVMHWGLTPTDYGPVPLVRGADFRTIQTNAHTRLVHRTLSTLDPRLTYLMSYDFFFWAYQIPHRRLTEGDWKPDHLFDRVIIDLKYGCPIVGPQRCVPLLRRVEYEPAYRLDRQEDGIYFFSRLPNPP